MSEVKDGRFFFYWELEEYDILKRFLATVPVSGLEVYRFYKEGAQVPVPGYKLIYLHRERFDTDLAMYEFAYPEDDITRILNIIARQVLYVQHSTPKSIDNIDLRIHDFFTNKLIRVVPLSDLLKVRIGAPIKGY